MYFDVAMPITLSAVTFVSLFLNEKIETRLKSVFEGRELTLRDTIMLVITMGFVISLIVFIPQFAIMIVFLFSYSLLLFMFGYVFSNERWYVAILPPIVFVILYLFYSGTSIWFPYLLNLYGIIFAILITLYLGNLFRWKTTMIFVGLLTVMDVILVLFTGTMVSAARHVSGLKLPVLISVPTVPSIVTELGQHIYMSLGLGDFFFAGLIGIQSFKRYGKRFAIISLLAMSFSFFIFETILLTYNLMAFPGTLMIICGWLPLAIFKKWKH
jgi:presenilin-like A22 family membrane protease